MYEKGTAEEQACKTVCFLYSINIPIILFLFYSFSFLQSESTCIIFITSKTDQKNLGWSFIWTQVKQIEGIERVREETVRQSARSPLLCPPYNLGGTDPTPRSREVDPDWWKLVSMTPSSPPCYKLVLVTQTQIKESVVVFLGPSRVKRSNLNWCVWDTFYLRKPAAPCSWLPFCKLEGSQPATKPTPRGGQKHWGQQRSSVAIPPP